MKPVPSIKHAEGSPETGPRRNTQYIWRDHGVFEKGLIGSPGERKRTPCEQGENDPRQPHLKDHRGQCIVPVPLRSDDWRNILPFSHFKTIITRNGTTLIFLIDNFNIDTAMGTMLKYDSEESKQFYEMFVLKPEHARKEHYK